jgi:hypothetical protein
VTIVEAGGAVSGAGARSIAFQVEGHPCTLDVPPPGEAAIASVFFIGLPKAGSSLLAGLMRPLVQASGLAYLAVQEAMFQMGVPPNLIPAEVNQAFQPVGYAFAGFRGLPGALALPPFAADRTMLLVRDPRDMLTSLYFSHAYSHRPPGQGVGGQLAETFEQRRATAQSLDIDAFVLDRAKMVAGQYRVIGRKLAGVPHQVYRYEDVIFDKLTWVNHMLNRFGLAPPRSLVERIVAESDERPAQEDPSRHVRRVTPGDHKEKLAPGTIAALDAQLGPALEAYGYA